MMKLESALNDFLGRRFGVTIRRNRDRRDGTMLFLRKCRERGVRTILDVGSNTGQFAQEVRAKGWTGAILSFEPQPDAHAQLVAKAALDPLWFVAPVCGVGGSRGSAEFKVSRNSVSSSFYDITSASTDIIQATEQTRSIEVAIMPLDELMQADCPSPYGLKIDTQGFELEVLAGATNVLREVPVSIIEMSFARLYTGGASAGSVMSTMEQAGYRCIGTVEAFADTANEEVLQIDGVFVRDEAA